MGEEGRGNEKRRVMKRGFGGGGIEGGWGF